MRAGFDIAVVRRSIVVAAAAISMSLAIAGVYRPASRGVFIWDDHALIERNPALESGSLSDLLLRPFWTPEPGNDSRPAYYRPVTSLSFRIDAALASGDRGATFHQTNILFHALNAVLLAGLAWRLGASTTAAFVGALCWALLPRSTESVAWISGRTDVLATLGVFGAMACWPWGLGRPKGNDGIRDSQSAVVGGVVFASVFLFLGLASKETAIAGVAPLAVGTWFVSSPRERRRRLPWLAVPPIAFVLLRRRALLDVAWPTSNAKSTARWPTIFEAIARYAEMLVNPWRPNASIGVAESPDAWRTRIGIALVVATLSASAIFLYRRRKKSTREEATSTSDSPRHASGACVGLALAFASLLPVLQFVPLPLNGAVVADRLLYLPTAGIAIALATSASHLAARHRSIVGALALSAAASFAVVTHAHVGIYQDELLFWLDTVEGSPPSSTGPRTALANLVRQLGEHRVACALHASVRETLLGEGRVGTARFRRAEENLAGCITLLGHYDEARTIYLELLARRPNDARVNMELGYAWLHVFAFDETEAAMERALALEPALPSPRKVLSDLPRLRSEHLALAAPERRRLAPMKWASLLTSVGRLPDAERAWLEIIEDPRSSRRAASDAVDFLLANGSFSNAEHGFAMYRAKVDASEDLPVEREALDKRRRQQARLDAVRPRLEALVGHTPFDER